MNLTHNSFQGGGIRLYKFCKHIFGFDTWHPSSLKDGGRETNQSNCVLIFDAEVSMLMSNFKIQIAEDLFS